MNFKTVKVGVIQATPALFDLEGSIDRIITWIQQGAEAGCQLLLFPESFIPCYPRGLTFEAVIGKRTEKGRIMWLDYWANSLTVPSAQLSRISDVVQKAGLVVALGVVCTAHCFISAKTVRC